MIDFLKYVVAPLIAAFILIMSIATSLVYLNAKWNCYSWHKNTGQDTKVIAAECYVREGDIWVIFDTHVKNHHVEIHNDNQ